MVRLASRAARQAVAHLPDQAVHDRPEVAARPGGHRPLPLVTRSGLHEISHRRELGQALQPRRDRLEPVEQVVEVVGDEPLAVLRVEDDLRVQPKGASDAVAAPERGDLCRMPPSAPDSRGQPAVNGGMWICWICQDPWRRTLMERDESEAAKILDVFRVRGGPALLVRCRYQRCTAGSPEAASGARATLAPASPLPGGAGRWRPGAVVMSSPSRHDAAAASFAISLARSSA